MIRNLLTAAALGLAVAAHAAPPAAAPAPAAKQINYDCTKAGNKNKAACKTAAAPVAAAPVAVKPAPAAVAVARPAAAARPNTVAAVLKNGKTVHYDCSKAGNQTKTSCKKA